MARISNFTKIEGFQHVNKCRICGKKSLSEKNNPYCRECTERMQKEAEMNAAREERAAARDKERSRR
jgi:RecJ-like exonuclease